MFNTANFNISIYYSVLSVKYIKIQNEGKKNVQIFNKKNNKEYKGLFFSE